MHGQRRRDAHDTRRDHAVLHRAAQAERVDGGGDRAAHERVGGQAGQLRHVAGERQRHKDDRGGDDVQQGGAVRDRQVGGAPVEPRGGLYDDVVPEEAVSVVPVAHGELLSGGNVP